MACYCHVILEIYNIDNSVSYLSVHHHMILMIILGYNNHTIISALIHMILTSFHNDDLDRNPLPIGILKV